MFLGHYGVAFAAKRAAPRTSLGTFAFAAQFADELWPILLLLGVEHVRIVPGYMAANPLEFTSYPWSHSLLMLAVWGAIIGGVYYAVKRDRRGALVVGTVVVSHWVLDFPMHAADLALWPGSTKFGLGAWNSVPLTMVLDVGTFIVGLFIYLRSTTARDRVGSWSLWAMVIVLLGIYVGSSFGPPPASVNALAVSALALWLFIPWAAWVDRHRTVSFQPPPVQ
jgi:hypothetical protein